VAIMQNPKINKMNRRFFKLLFITFVLIANNLLGQIPKNIFNEITEEKFNSKNFTNSTNTLKQKVGVYHFGESESEWDLVFLPYKDSIVIQIWNGIWAEELGFKNQNWFHKCQTFNNVRIKENKFYFGNYSGQFVDYIEGKTKTKAVVLFSDPIEGRNYESDSAEVGFYSTSIDTFFDDKERYELSLEIKPEAFFAKKTKQELKILRNTIYANYGLIFQKGGEMEKYFSRKEWYQAWQKDVSNCLTYIEKINLNTLKKFEEH
jgi:hypothetical protein